ncbi:hypothetical protein MRX96_013136 [Rhipicephalus microplus]
MPLEDMVFIEYMYRQEDEASGWIIAHSWKNRRQDFTAADSPGPNAGNSAAHPVLPKGADKQGFSLMLPGSAMSAFSGNGFTFKIVLNCQLISGTSAWRQSEMQW